MEKGEAAFCGRFHTTDNSSLGSDLPGKVIRFKIILNIAVMKMVNKLQKLILIMIVAEVKRKSKASQNFVLIYFISIS